MPRRLLSSSSTPSIGALLERLAVKVGAPVDTLRTASSLDLRRTELSPDDLAIVATLAEENSRIESIDMTSNGFGAAGAEHIRTILKRCTHLRKLFLGNNNLRAGVCTIAEALHMHGLPGVIWSVRAS